MVLTGREWPSWTTFSRSQKLLLAVVSTSDFDVTYSDTLKENIDTIQSQIEPIDILMQFPRFAAARNVQRAFRFRHRSTSCRVSLSLAIFE